MSSQDFAAAWDSALTPPVVVVIVFTSDALPGLKSRTADPEAGQPRNSDHGDRDADHDGDGHADAPADAGPRCPTATPTRTTPTAPTAPPMTPTVATAIATTVQGTMVTCMSPTLPVAARGVVRLVKIAVGRIRLLAPQ